MGTFGINVNRKPANLGGLSTQPLPLIANVTAATIVSNNGVATNQNTDQTNSLLLSAMPPIIVNQAMIPIIQASLPNAVSLSSNNSDISRAAQINQQNPTIRRDAAFSNVNVNVANATGTDQRPILSFPEMIDPMLATKPRDKRPLIFHFPPKTSVNINKVLPPSADTLRLGEIKIENNTFKPISKNGISVFRPEILGMVNFNPIFWPENKNEFTDAGRFLSINYQSQVLRRSTLDKIIEKIKASNDRQLVQSLSDSQNITSETVKGIDDKLNIFANNENAIKDIKRAFEVKEIEDAAYKKSEFLTLKQFFEQKMQYSEASYSAFADTKILMQLFFDLRSSLEGYSYSLLNLVDNDRVGDLNPIILDKTFTRNNNFTFSIESIKSTGTSGRLAIDSNEFTQFVNSLPSDLGDRLKLLLHLTSKELRVSRGLSKTEVRNTLGTFYDATPDGNPFDNIVGSVGNDIFDEIDGTNSIASLAHVSNGSVTVLPFENKTVDDSQTTYVPGPRYFGDAIIGTNGVINLNPFNDYVNRYSGVLSKAKNVIDQMFEFSNENFNLLPESIFLDFLQAIKDGLASIGSNSINSNNDQITIASILRLGNKDNVLKLMIFQFFLLSGIASIDKQDDKKIFKRLIEDVANQIKNFTYVRVGELDDPDLTGGLQTLKPYLIRLAEDIETKIFSLINPTASTTHVSLPVIKSLVISNADQFSEITNAASKIGAGVIIGQNNRINAASAASQPRALNASSKVGTTFASDGTHTGNLLDRGTIKSTLLSAIESSGVAATNLLKEFIDMSVKLDNNASIQGNKLSYVLENNSTRFNFVSTSHLLLFVFEIFSSFLGRFFVVDFTETINFSKISLSYDSLQNKTMFDYIEELLVARKAKNQFSPVDSGLFKQNISPAPPSLKNISLSPTFAISNKIANVNTMASTLSSLRQVSSNIFAGIGASTNVTSVPQNNTANVGAAISLSVVLENLSNMSLQANNSKVGSFSQRIGFAGAINRDFASTNVGIESIKEAIDAGTMPFHNYVRDIGANTQFDPATLRKLNDLKQSIVGIKDKCNDEDLYIKNSLHLLDVIGDRLALINTRVNSFFTALGTNELQIITKYSDTINNGQIMLSNWIQKTYKQNINLFGSYNVVYRDEYHAMVSLLSEELYTKNLSGNRVKLLAIGIPAGFSEKLLDRVSRNEISVENLKDLESDIININIYKKNSANDDVVYYPQRFTFDLSLFPKEITNLSINPKTSFEQNVARISMYDFEDTGNINGNIVGLQEITSNQKYSFMSPDEKRTMIRNHITSYLLQTYTYLISGISFSEEVFPSLPYSDMGPNAVLNDTTEALLRAYYKIVIGTDYPAKTSISNALLDPAVPDNIKDDIQLMLYSSGILKPSLIESKVLNNKKFDRVFIVPLNIDDFIINIEQTNQTSSGKRAMASTLFQNTLTKVPVGNNTLYKENRDLNKNALIFEEYFVTIDTARK